MTTPQDEVAPLLERFLADARRTVPLVALWAHGSLALGDFQPGRSDFDLIAVVGADLVDGLGNDHRRQLRRLHKALARDMPLAAKLHCSYVVESTLPDVGRRHVTWAQQRLMTRPVGPVSRRELTTGGKCLYGPPPAGLLPAVTDRELADFIRRDLRDFWYPASAKRTRWLQDVWVDLGPLTLARATVTLRDGRLITKGEALDVLASLDAPPDVVRDIRRRRYDPPPHPVSLRWRLERAHLARTFVRDGIDRALLGAE